VLAANGHMGVAPVRRRAVPVPEPVSAELY
jgi:hypothetical protein